MPRKCNFFQIFLYYRHSLNYLGWGKQLRWWKIFYSSSLSMLQLKNDKPLIITQLELNDLVRDLTILTTEWTLSWPAVYNNRTCWTKMFEYHNLGSAFRTYSNSSILKTTRLIVRITEAYSIPLNKI